MSGIQLRVISLGAGVQSTAMALMAAHGEITPMPDYAIFADTGWEPKAVYDHLRWLMSPNVLPFPVHIISRGNIRDDTISRHSSRSGRFVSVPWFTRTVKPNGAYRDGMGRRQCTAHYKLEPIALELRRLLGKPGRKRIAPGTVEIWIGISTDEELRKKPPRQMYQAGRWPLLEQKMSRTDCLRWLADRGYPKPPKSSCIGCPFHDSAAWRALTPAEFADACEVDASIREGGALRGIRGQQFMHRSMKPLIEADLSEPVERQANLFINECEGICGV